MSQLVDTLPRNLLFLFLVSITSSCTYFDYVARQAKLKEEQLVNPSQYNLKHIIGGETFFIYGKVLDPEQVIAAVPIVVIAFSNQYDSNEIVDSTRLSRSGTHYGMNLPAGEYDLVALADQNHNGVVEQLEVVGRLRVQLDSREHRDRVVANQDINVTESETVDWDIRFSLPRTDELEESLFYPQGTIRTLDDPLFNAGMARLGMYEPSAFLERAPTLFYALEEDSVKIPVVFVHGIGGSARDFDLMVDNLDKNRYQAWFFHYPSGGDLNQLANIFYDIFLSGNINARGKTPLVVVAHSMGGVIVREALNRYDGSKSENRLPLVISLSTPFDGHSGAAMGEKYGALVLPSWRNLNPDSDFIRQLYRQTLPPEIKHVLIYTQVNQKKRIVAIRGDGVVTVASQLRPDARLEAAEIIESHSSHAEVLKDKYVINRVVELIHQVESSFPANHNEARLAGGFDVDLGDHFTEIEKHYIQTIGVYLSLLAQGKLDTLGESDLTHFVDVAQGNAKAVTATETAWLKLVKDYPDAIKWPL